MVVWCRCACLCADGFYRVFSSVCVIVVVLVFVWCLSVFVCLVVIVVFVLCFLVCVIWVFQCVFFCLACVMYVFD